MSNEQIGWEPLLQATAPPGAQLAAALFTTYDAPDEQLLVEHLLPQLLQLQREPVAEGPERTLFLVELDRSLKRLHDKISVVSGGGSVERDADAGATVAYPWIWRHIRPLTVGKDRRAVQHAKLWLLHWHGGAGDARDYLEVVVSSANLTLSAFKGQLQGGWRVVLPLTASPSATRRRSWGVLPPFLEALGRACGDPKRMREFIELLGRADCPTGVTFLASVPGAHSRFDLKGLPWGAAGLADVVPGTRGAATMQVLTPYVGTWSADAIEKWCARLGSRPDRLELAWIEKRHPWAQGRRWVLPATSLTALLEAGARVLRIRDARTLASEPDLLHAEHRAHDERWGHAKLYGLTRGGQQSLVITSANWSAAAWGREGVDGSLSIDNFELGVAVARTAWPLPALYPFPNPDEIATVQVEPQRATVPIAWAEASWDGAEVAIRCRVREGSQPVGEVRSAESAAQVKRWVKDKTEGSLSTRVPWSLADGAPSQVRLSLDAQTLFVPVFDGRAADELDTVFPPDVDATDGRSLSDALLFEEYGGPAAGEDGADALTLQAPPEADEDGHDSVAAGDSFAVPALSLARHHFAVVDGWSAQFAKASESAGGINGRDWVLRDGARLVEAFLRQSARDSARGPGCALAARLAADELQLRVKQGDVS